MKTLSRVYADFRIKGCYQLEAQVRGQVRREVWDQVRYQASSQILDQVLCRVGDQVRHQVRD